MKIDLYRRWKGMFGGTKKEKGGKAGSKLAVLGGDALFCNAQWATANLEDRENRILVAEVYI